jgi:hypothetical protein
LASVKLRKVVREETHEKENSPRTPLAFGLKKCPGGKFVSPRRRQDNQHPFITLKDIRKVSLKKTQSSDSAVKRRCVSNNNNYYLFEIIQEF